MIIDQLTNWLCYANSVIWQQAFEFLLALPPDPEEKRYELRGNDMFAQVASYQTQPFTALQFETHRKYIDIQAVLHGRERILIAPRSELVVDKAYDANKDVEFYLAAPGQTHLGLSPGTFVMLFPQDAHMPGVMLGDRPQTVKKLVMKINAELLQTVK
jgi:biofilm protein TabA